MFIHSTIIGAITSFTFLVSPVAALAMPLTEDSAHAIQAFQKRGGIDMEDACAREQGKDWQAVTHGSGCNDWLCVTPDGRQKMGLNLNLYCFETVGVNSYASCSGGIWGWSCNTY